MSEAFRIFDSSASREARRVAPSATPEPGTFRGRIIDAIKTVYDPEIPVNVHDLGLIYGIGFDDAEAAAGRAQVSLQMTLTSPACPEAQSLPKAVRDAVAALDFVSGAEVTLVWEPRWDRSMMCDEALLELGLL